MTNRIRKGFLESSGFPFRSPQILAVPPPRMNLQLRGLQRHTHHRDSSSSAWELGVGCCFNASLLPAGFLPTSSRLNYYFPLFNSIKDSPIGNGKGEGRGKHPRLKNVLMQASWGKLGMTKP